MPCRFYKLVRPSRRSTPDLRQVDTSGDLNPRVFQRGKFSDPVTVAAAVKGAPSVRAALLRLGVATAQKNYDRLLAACCHYGIDPPPHRRLRRSRKTPATTRPHSIADDPGRRVLRALADKHHSKSDILRELGKPVRASAYSWLRRLAEQHAVELPNGRTAPSSARNRYRIPLDRILTKDSTYTCSRMLKRRLIEEGLLEEKCYGQACPVSGPVWRNEPITLQLEHKNGIATDNRINNLTLLCPNCHSQTDTYSGRNRFRTR